ncbi:RNA recognition motif domain-containing protein [Entamoeba histolytica HM-1:IMSS-B]|uniref:RNA recognition motif domain containing protein n=4 Tax=Entamoeba histolytica TaxID=5759 RepID=C4LZD4_ENTH1|nr:RNA recognition motif domain containing protein [Entamoeba histolytica HM-1:IMSS]EAL48654.1 RNA recognition motif domain containing protein [Entamoeba histolytica HM-1:IMSS]EMH76480.1 RNA recognition motif domain-containing protein [Entamoeba histolytica HM-1:IMSS-B]ENY60832.1 RNA recognition motif domain containing protein [Entamoeba histolytica HM-1:IMSS-A]GAT94217.1 RNA recognition motif domain containing protein [Entamoeba histolytica]|eukprot:XP_654040.1 RNA recognition motif domain containing protein [Entamoeba histolytica HM-1:IMSS]
MSLWDNTAFSSVVKNTNNNQENISDEDEETEMNGVPMEEESEDENIDKEEVSTEEGISEEEDISNEDDNENEEDISNEDDDDENEEEDEEEDDENDNENEEDEDISNEEEDEGEELESKSEEDIEEDIDAKDIVLGGVPQKESDKEDSSEEDEKPKYKSKKERKELSLITHSKEAERTVFIANVNIKVKPAQMKKFLKQFGKLESYRFRGGAFIQDEKSKKVHFLKKEYDTKVRKTQNCYAVYTTPEDAEKAAKEIDGKEFLGYHLRADWEVNKGKKRNIRQTIFVGNLPFKMEEEQLRKLFSKAGEIERVKIVRESKSGMGRGIGFVTFTNKEDVQKGLNMVGEKVKGRQIRVEPCYKNYDKIKQKKAERITKALEMKKERKRVYKERVKANMGKLAKQKQEKKPTKKIHSKQ